MEKREQIRKWFQGDNISNYWFAAVPTAFLAIILLFTIGEMKNPIAGIIFI